VPLIAATLGVLLLMGLASALMSGPESDANQRQSVAMREQQSGAGQRSSSAAGRNLSLTQQFFQPNREKNVEYTTKKFENNTTVALYRKTSSTARPLLKGGTLIPHCIITKKTFETMGRLSRTKSATDTYNLREAKTGFGF